jgi:ribose 5-phosphate isomerase
MLASSSADGERHKRAAAARAVELVMPDMVLGLGSGSTANLVLEALRHR